MNDQKRLTFLGHLEELRQRLIRSVVVLALATVISFAFADSIFNILKMPAGNLELVFIELTEMVGTYFRVCLFTGIIISMPYLVYQLLAFVSPALTSQEKKHLYIVLPWVALMFLAGVVFAFFVLLPPAVKILLSFGEGVATPQIRVGNYVSLVTRVLLATGLVFQLPVITTFLSRLGVLSPKWLAERRRGAVLVSFIAAAIVTPTVDPINQTLIAGTLILLFEMSIWLARAFQRRTPEIAATNASKTRQKETHQTT